MKKIASVLFLLFFTLHLADAQAKKSVKGSGSDKKPVTALKGALEKKNSPSSGVSSQSNDFAAQRAALKIPPFMAGTFGDSISKMIPSLQGREEALSAPYIVVAPPVSDQKNHDLFLKLAKSAVEEKGIQNRIINSSDQKEWVALAFNNPASLLELANRKELLFLKTYCFSSLKALEESKDPYVAYLRKEKSLAKLISFQNIDYLPTSAEIKQSNDQLAP